MTFRGLSFIGLSTFLAAFAFCGRARAGTIQTLSGHAYHGLISIGPRGDLAVSQPLEGIARVAPDDVLEVTFREADEPPAMQQGVVLTDGTAIAGEIVSADASAVHYARNGKEIVVPLERVARIVFRPPSARAMTDLAPGRYGAILSNGDFYQGELKGIDNGSMRLGSVLFGDGQFTAGDQADAVVLADVKPARSDWVVRLTDGSVLMASSLKLDDGKVIAEDMTEGTFTLAPNQVVGYQCGPNRLECLANLKPTNIDPAQDGAYAADRTTAGVAMALGDGLADRGVGVASGATVTYDLGGNYKAFMCRAGVPAALVPAAKVRFIVIADGKLIFRTAERTSVDDSVAVSLPVAGVRTLVLKVEGDVEGDLGASGLWAEPSLVKN